MTCGARIEKGRRFIENQRMRVSENQTREGNLLRLGWGNLESGRTEFSVESLRKLLNPFEGVDGVEGR